MSDLAQASSQPEQVSAAELAVAGLDLLTRGVAGKAAALAERARALAPDEPAGWQLACEVARAAGRLEEAAAAARRWAALAPTDDQARAMAAVLNGDPLPAGYPGLAAVPFILVDDFLSPERHAQVVAYYLEAVVDLIEASVVKGDGKRVRDEAARSARVGYEPTALRSWFLPLVTRHFPECFRRFAIPVFEPARLELQLTASFHGDFYKAHRDYDPEKPNGVETRRISYVYYFRPPGGTFEEGQLRLYDWRKPDAVAAAKRYTTVQPLDNRLILFPSHALHEVMAVRALSGRVEDGRFTLNGWANVAPPAAA